MRNGLIGMGVALFALIVLSAIIVLFRRQFFVVVVPKNNVDSEW